MMDVWDPNDKTTILSQIKKAIRGPVSGFKRMTRVIVWSILIVFYFFIFILLLSGCAYFQKDKIDDDEIIITDLLPLEESSGEVGEPIRAPSEIIACIKLLPECDAS
jgi:cytochrome b561